MDVLGELGPEEAERWRSIIEQDEVRQQPAATSGEGQGFSEQYLAGMPHRPATGL